MLVLFLSFIIVLVSGLVFYSKLVVSRLLTIGLVKRYPGIITVVFQLFALVVFLLANRLAWNVGITKLGLGLSQLVITVFLSIVITLSAVVSVWYFVVRPNPGVRLSLGFGKPKYTQEFILIWLFVAPFEELIFRGLVFRGLESILDSWLVAALISSILFGVLHLVNKKKTLLLTIQNCVFSGIVGLIFTVLVYYTGNLYLVIAFHAFMHGMFGVTLDPVPEKDKGNPLVLALPGLTVAMSIWVAVLLS